MANNPKASIEQTSFLGGEWGPLAYGKSDDPHYSTAMTLSLNGYPCEEGSWLKRSSTQFLCPTYQGGFANDLTFNGSDTCAFAMEFTSPAGVDYGMLRLLTQSFLVCDGADGITATSGGNITLGGAPGWNIGDEVFVVFPPGYLQANEANLRDQVCTITNISGANVTISGFFTGPFTGSSPQLVGCQLLHILHIQTPYTGGPSQLNSIRAVQAEIDSFLLCPSVPIQQLQITTQGTLSSDPTFSFGPVTCIDGPYLDPQAQTLTVGGYSGTILVTSSGPAFVATDAGRAIRIFTQPPIYNSASAYSTGDNVTDSSGAWWQAIGAVNPGTAPGMAQTNNGVATVVWAPNPTAGSWAWGLINNFISSTQVSVNLDSSIPNMALQPANGTTAYEWQLGVYSTTTGYPTCGLYYEGRIWLAGCVPNRFDTSTSNGVSFVIGTNSIQFSPTDPYGNVLDSSGMSEVLNSVGINQIQWMIGDAAGVIMGTLSGETLVAASQLGDPLTPTSIQAHEITRYGSEDIEATRAGMAVIFAQKYGRRLMEYLDDTFSSKFSGRHLNKYSKHLTASGIARVTYQEEPIPTLWCLMNNGVLAGCTYRRFTRFVSADPEAEGWHRHMHGAGRAFTSMCSVPGKQGLLDRLFVVTCPTPPDVIGAVNQGIYYQEILQPPFDPTTDTLNTAWMLDQCHGPGPGNSGYDCGGGNASAYATTGGIKASDSTTATAGGSPNSVVNRLAAAPLGQSPPAGGLIALNNAVYFPGTVILYGLPQWNNDSADVTMMSMSFWAGLDDFPMQQGALLSSPELSFSEAAPTGTQITSSFMGGCTTGGATGNGIPYTGSNNVLAANSTSDPTYPYGGVQQQAQITGTGNTHWVHVMVSAKSNGDGTITTLVVCNDTVQLASTTSAPDVGSHGAMWPFSSQPDKQKDNGTALWNLGGAFVQSANYTISAKVSAGPPFTYQVPPLIQILNGYELTGVDGKLPSPILGGDPPIYLMPAALGLGVPASLNAYATLYGLPMATDAAGVAKILFSPVSHTIQTEIVTTAGSGGPNNMPTVNSNSSLTGYVGNVAELWVMPGQFVDWTNAAIRAKFHEYDTITESWGPVSLGLSGQTPLGEVPWLYCSGPPNEFPLNNANGQFLTEYDSISGLIDFQTGLSGGLQDALFGFPGTGT